MTQNFNQQLITYTSQIHSNNWPKGFFLQNCNSGNYNNNNNNNNKGCALRKIEGSPVL